VRRKGTPPPAPLSPELRALLLYGPWRDGVLHPSPPHDALRVLWTLHGEALTATLTRGQQPWFVEKDWFISVLRGETKVDWFIPRKRDGTP
jgi:hypothetical protein